jgi:ActR/RegA family two-component response regulator
LLVDDDPLTLEGLDRQLRSRYDVTVARGSKEAMRLVVSQAPFAVVVAGRLLNKPQIEKGP